MTQSHEYTPPKVYNPLSGKYVDSPLFNPNTGEVKQGKAVRIIGDGTLRSVTFPHIPHKPHIDWNASYDRPLPDDIDQSE